MSLDPDWMHALIASTEADPANVPLAAEELWHAGATLPDVLVWYAGTPPDHDDGLPHSVLVEWCRGMGERVWGDGGELGRKLEAVRLPVFEPGKHRENDALRRERKIKALSYFPNVLIRRHSERVPDVPGPEWDALLTLHMETEVTLPLTNPLVRKGLFLALPCFFRQWDSEGATWVDQVVRAPNLIAPPSWQVVPQGAADQVLSTSATGQPVWVDALRGEPTTMDATWATTSSTPLQDLSDYTEIVRQSRERMAGLYGVPANLVRGGSQDGSMGADSIRAIQQQGVFAPHPMTPEEAAAAFDEPPATWRFGRLDQIGLFPQERPAGPDEE